MNVFPEKSLNAFLSAYPGSAVKFDHDLRSHPLLEPDRLARLGEGLPEAQVEYNLGDIGINQPDPENMPANGMSVAETLANIERAGSWVALRNVETDPEYRALMMDCLEQVLPRAKKLTGAWYRPEAFIFVSSPGAVTPFHLDPEHNILMQVVGEKTFNMFPADDPQLVSASLHEAYHKAGKCRLVYDEASMAAKGTAWHLAPGEALYVPVKAPHWVRNGQGVSISLSITWRSDHSDRHRRVYRLNGLLRKAGLNPPIMAEADPRTSIKDISARVLDKAGLL